MSVENEHPLLKSARREMIGALTIWLTATTYSVSYCWAYGYGRDPQSLTFVLGFPDWVFWGIVLPWGVCTLVSTWFALAFMKNEELEEASTTQSPTA